jgi:uncharacterized protein YndB with AHSA1/START domain
MVDSTDNSNHLVVKREVDVAADPEQVWEALATDEGRDRWLEPDPAREIRIESVEEPNRLVWWWWSDDAAPRRVEILVVAAPLGSRVIVSESAPSFPLELLARGLAPMLACA